MSAIEETHMTGSTPDNKNDTPRWVKISGAVAGVLILLVAIMIISGIGGPHGPGRHIPSDSMPTEYGQ